MTTKRKDFSQVAFDVVQRATGETVAPAPNKKQEIGRKQTAQVSKKPKKQPPAR